MYPEEEDEKVRLRYEIRQLTEEKDQLSQEVRNLKRTIGELLEDMYRGRAEPADEH